MFPMNKKKVRPVKAKVNITFTDVTGKDESPIKGDVIRDRMGMIKEAMGVDDLPKEENDMLLEKTTTPNSKKLAELLKSHGRGISHNEDEPVDDSYCDDYIEEDVPIAFAVECGGLSIVGTESCETCGNTQHKDYVINVEINEMSTDRRPISICGCIKGDVPAISHIEIPPAVYLLAKELFRSCGLTDDVSITHYSGNDFVIGKDADNELTLALFVTAAAYARYIYETFGYKVADNIEAHKRIFADIAVAITSQYLQKFAKDTVCDCENYSYDNTCECDDCCDYCHD